MSNDEGIVDDDDDNDGMVVVFGRLEDAVAVAAVVVVVVVVVTGLCKGRDGCVNERFVTVVVIVVFDALRFLHDWLGDNDTDDTFVFVLSWTGGNTEASSLFMMLLFVV
jgi:hypothetical protein